MEQCTAAAACGPCYPDSPCKSATSWVGADQSDQPARTVFDLGKCMEKVTAPARSMSLPFASFNGGQNSRIHNVSQCGFQQLLLLTDTNPIHLVILFKAADDLNVVKLLRKAAKSVGGGVALRNRVFVPQVGMNFVTFLGFPSPGALVKMLGSPDFSDAVSRMKAEWSAVSMSVTRMNLDVRVAVTDCAHQPWNFDASLPLPWPEKRGLENTNKAFLIEDRGGAAQNLIFNKALSQEAASGAVFDYSLGVAEATFKHGFKPHVAFTCIPAASGSSQRTPDFCRSVQLVGDTLMGYDTIRVVEYPSRRAMLSMMNDQSWKIEDKKDEWESNTGLPSEPIIDATITDVPQLVTSSFKVLTGFEQSPTGCSVAVRQGQTRAEILTQTCFKKTVVKVGSFGDPCIPVFEASASCPKACQALMRELQPCLGGFWNTYDAGDALLLRAMKAGGITAKDAAFKFSPRAWYLEVERRGCRASVVSTSSRIADVSLMLVVINIVMILGWGS